MKIKLDETHTLHSDQYCYWITRLTTVNKGKAKGTTIERALGWYSPTFHDAITKYIEKKIGDSEATTYYQLSKEIEELKKEVRGWKLKLEE